MSGKPLRYSPYSSPIGEILMARSGLGLTDIGLREAREGFVERLSLRSGIAPVEDDKGFKRLFGLFTRYFGGAPVTFDVPLDLDGTGFEMAVWKALAEIPWGGVRSYGWVASRIGSPKAGRAVGGACGANPVPIVIPCHRVVGVSNIGGYTGGLDVKRFLLKLEGVEP
ncbi:MAG: methylated-DNA--[protein]-cysteine S-methyltransferase [Deltaproteobacteria bacterium]|nr:methylated-DNA--[protein]-cysteine S-methyltransferase [Deltaproteobacteria bacterium]